MTIHLRSLIPACTCLALSLLLSCSGNLDQATVVQPATSVSIELPPSGMPGFPVERESAVIIDSTIKGSEYLEKSDRPLSTLNSLAFDVPAANSDYAIYCFSAGDDQLLKLSIDLTLSSGRAPWVGLANFSTTRWQFGAPVQTGSEEFDLTAGPQYKSPGGNFYFAVVGWDVSSFIMNGATVQTDRDLFSISGVVFDPLDSLNVQDISVFLSPLGTEILTDAAGNYSFDLLPPGSYTLSPSSPGYGFNPVSIDVELVDSDVSGQDFMVEDLGLPQYSVSGNVQYDLGGGLQNVLLSLSPGGYSTTTDVDGNFSLGGVVNGSYTLTPLLAGYDFAPLEISVDVADADNTGNDFTASDSIVPTYSISGAVSVGTAYLKNVSITINPGGYNTLTDDNGAYSISGLAAGNYTVTPTKSGFLFTPPSAAVEIVAADVSGVNFDAMPDNSGNFNVSGLVQGPPGGLSGATITLQPGNHTALSGGGGGYTVANVPSGIYTATCTKSGWTITPFSQQVVVADANVTGINWFASPPL